MNKKKVLVVDDNRLICNLLYDVLVDEYDVEVYMSLHDCESLFDEADAVLVDASMMNTPRVNNVVLTTTSLRMFARCKKLGYEVLMKPFHVDDVYNILEHVMSNNLPRLCFA